MSEITPATERKLRDAMERLLTGTAVRTDGRIIKENLYREAGVSRATMNRATALMDEWSQRVDGTQPRDCEIEALKRRLNEIYVKHTGRDYDTIHTALERDNFMTADAAKEFGLIDEVIEKRPEPAAA